MKKKILILCMLFLLISGCSMIENNEEITNTVVYIIEDIQYDKELNKISGTSVEGPYLGEVEIYLPDHIDTTFLEDGMVVKARCHEGMTMSLPPQLMGCISIEKAE